MAGSTLEPAVPGRGPGLLQEYVRTALGSTTQVQPLPPGGAAASNDNPAGSASRTTIGPGESEEPAFVTTRLYRPDPPATGATCTVFAIDRSACAVTLELSVAEFGFGPGSG